MKREPNSSGEGEHGVFNRATRFLSESQSGTLDPRELFTWLAESPRHVEELGYAMALAREIGRLTDTQRRKVEEIAAKLPSCREAALPHAGEKNVVDLRPAVSLTDRTGLSGHRRARRPGRAAAVAAVFALAACAGAWTYWKSLGEIQDTQVGEQRKLELADGSVVHLNTDSRVRVHFDGSTRLVMLQRGEALFSVRRDPARAFIVDTGDMRIQALGTQFNVYRKKDGTRVAVLEGAVRVTQENPGLTTGSADVQQLDAGDAAALSQGRITRRSQSKAADSIAWRQRRLIFRDDTLLDIANEFNRYNRSLRIRVEGELAQRQRFAGTFDADEPEALVAALTADKALRIERSRGEIVIR